MDISNESPLKNEFDPPETQDEFASGAPNKARLLALRLIRWLFGPPYFPAALIWFLLAVITVNIAVELLTQPADFWLDPSRSTFYTFLMIPSSWGLWTVGIQIVYIILVGLTLSLINVWAAFVIWLGLGLYHLVAITESFRCGATNSLLVYSVNCSSWHTLVITLAGLIWGIGIFAAAKLGLVTWALPAGETSYTAPAWGKRLGILSKVLIVLMASTVIITAVSVPRPYWQVIQAENMPPARTEAALAYDTSRSTAVLFGGAISWTQTTDWTSANDTWEWNGNEWNQLYPEHAPPSRLGAGMAFDEARGVTVLFGGSGQDAANQKIFMGDTWEWDGRDWTLVSPALSPPARESALMFFDPLRQTVVLFGGYFFDQLTQTSIFLEDVWEWDGESWRRLDFDQPRKVTSAAILYDPLQQTPLLMDGEGLWEMQDGFWVQPGIANSPPNRWGSEMVFDTQHQQIVLFGGSMNQNVFDDTWSYDGQSWRQVITETQPPRRGGHNLFYDQTRNTILLFGGLDGGTLYNDMWELVRP